MGDCPAGIPDPAHGVEVEDRPAGIPQTSTGQAHRGVPRIEGAHRGPSGWDGREALRPAPRHRERARTCPQAPRSRFLHSEAHPPSARPRSLSQRAGSTGKERSPMSEEGTTQRRGVPG